MTETSDRPVEADPTSAPHPFLRGPEVADRVARLLQSVSSRASEIEAEIAREAHEAGDEDTARRLGTLLARWSATVGAYEQASMGSISGRRPRPQPGTPPTTSPPAWFPRTPTGSPVLQSSGSSRRR